MASCDNCDLPLDEGSGRGRPRKYCSVGCRMEFSRRRHKHAPHGKKRAHALWRQTGIRLADYERLAAMQSRVLGPGCAICGSLFMDKMGRSLAADHDHTTGLFRGLLCSRCNRAIGAFQDDAALLRSAAGYIANPPGAALQIYRRKRT